MASRASKIIDVLVKKASSTDGKPEAEARWIEEMTTYDLWKELIPLLRQENEDLTDIIRLE